MLCNCLLWFMFKGKKCQLIQMQGGNWDKTNYHFSSLGRKILSLFFGWSHMQAWSRKKQGSAVRNWKREWHHENIKAYYCLSQIQFIYEPERGRFVPQITMADMFLISLLKKVQIILIPFYPAVWIFSTQKTS